jgi:hypothetical protein
MMLIINKHHGNLHGIYIVASLPVTFLVMLIHPGPDSGTGQLGHGLGPHGFRGPALSIVKKLWLVTVLIFCS